MQSNSTPTDHHAQVKHWSQEISRLEHLQLALVPCIGKNPGALLGNGWETQAFTAAQLRQRYRQATGIGTRTGSAAGGLLVLDLDGETAIQWCKARDCDPTDAETWQVVRPDAPDRLKVLFTVPEELWHHLADGQLKTSLPTKEKTATSKGEAVELFFHSAAQVLLAGTHPEGAPYLWPEDRGPEDLSEIPPEWWALALEVADHGTDDTEVQQGPRETDRHDWQRLRNCPVCGRDKRPICSRHKDGNTYRCYQGQNFSPPQLKKGASVEILERPFVFTGAQKVGKIGTFSVFVSKGRLQDREEARALEGLQEHGETTTPAAPTAVPQRAKVLSIDDAKQRLGKELAEGISAADLAQLVAELADASDQPLQAIQRIADALQRQHAQAAAIEVEAKQFAAEADRQEIGQALTASYLLPPAIADALELRTRYLPTDGPAAVVPFLATVAGLMKLGTRVEASAVAGYRVPVNLFACLVGRSGAKKSPIGKLLVEAPTHELRAELARANGEALEQWREDCSNTPKGEPKPDPPPPKRLMVSEYTGEALAAQLEAQEAAGMGLLIHRDELSGLFGGLNQYRGGRGADEQQLLELFDGGGLTSLRVGGSRCYSRSQLSIYGGTQPDVLRQLVANGDASGLWARFLFVKLPERAVPLPLASTPAEEAAVAAAAQTLANACRAVYRLPPQTYKLAPAAAERFQHFEHCRQREALKTTIGAQGALYGKSAGKVLRLAGVLHLLELTAGMITSSDPIRADTIDRAAALVDHLDAWALSLHAEVAAGGVGGLMKKVHSAAKAAGGAIRLKELLARLSTKQRDGIDAAGFAQAAQALAAQGYGKVEAGTRGAISYRATGELP
jgi:hypothetical protein